MHRFGAGDERGWEPPHFRRFTLGNFNPRANGHEPTADPDGEDLLIELKRVFNEQGPTTKIVVALDAPLLASNRALPQRKKSQKAGEVERRDCDRTWAARMMLSPSGWRNINIQPGAPLPPRIGAVVEKVTAEGFRLFLNPSSPVHDRLLIECFPNEVIWSAGVIGHCAAHTFDTMTAYKRMGKSRTVLPLEILERVCDYTLRPCLNLAGLNAEHWLSVFWGWLSSDRLFASDAEGQTGKCFDDAIDSMLSSLQPHPLLMVAATSTKETTHRTDTLLAPVYQHHSSSNHKFVQGALSRL